MAAKLIAAFLGSRLQRAKHAWDDVDRHAVHFRSAEEMRQYLQAAKESNKELKRQQMSDYAKQHMLPRLVIGENLIPTVVAPTNTGHGLSPGNRMIVHWAMFGFVMALMGATSIYITRSTQTAAPREVFQPGSQPVSSASKAMTTDDEGPGPGPSEARLVLPIAIGLHVQELERRVRELEQLADVMKRIEGMDGSGSQADPEPQRGSALPDTNCNDLAAIVTPGQSEQDGSKDESKKDRPGRIQESNVPDESRSIPGRVQGGAGST